MDLALALGLLAILLFAISIADSFVEKGPSYWIASVICWVTERFD